LRFTLKSGETVGILGEVVREELQGNVLLKYRVAGTVDNAHPTFAER
jgi:hypothetical protein